MKRSEALKNHSADLILLVVLLLAAVSQVNPGLSAAFTIAACVVVAAFAIYSYLPEVKSKHAGRAVTQANPSRAAERVSHLYYHSICRFEPWDFSGVAIPNFPKMHGRSRIGHPWPVGAVSVARGTRSVRAHDRRTEFVDLTDALPDNCVVRIGLVEIRLEDGETSVRVKSQRDPVATKNRPSTLYLDPPDDGIDFAERQITEVN